MHIIGAVEQAVRVYLLGRSTRRVDAVASSLLLRQLLVYARREVGVDILPDVNLALDGSMRSRGLHGYVVAQDREV